MACHAGVDVGISCGEMLKRSVLDKRHSIRVDLTLKGNPITIFIDWAGLWLSWIDSNSLSGMYFHSWTLILLLPPT